MGKPPAQVDCDKRVSDQTHLTYLTHLTVFDRHCSAESSPGTHSGPLPGGGRQRRGSEADGSGTRGEVGVPLQIARLNHPTCLAT